VLIPAFRRKLASLAAHPSPGRLIVSRLLWKSGLCRYFSIQRPGFLLRFSPSAIAATYWANPEDRAEDERVLRLLLKPGDTYIDVGANIGSLALCGSTAVGAAGRVYAIEAHPRTFGFLAENVRLNRRGNVHLLNAALGSESGVLLMSDAVSDDQNRIDAAGTVKVEVKTLDEIVSGVEVIALIKMDVEGYELPVLKGARSALSHTQAVYFEAWEEHFAKYGYRTVDVLGLLREAGFSTYALQERTLRAIRPEYSSRRCENLLALKNPWEYCAERGLSIQ
jgi:FkbM family methyltransferase